jgi:hypothetical protein
MINVNYVIDYWAVAGDGSRFRNTVEFGANQHIDFTNKCLDLRAKNRFIKSSIKYDYLEEDWYRIMDEKIIIEVDRQRLIQENLS